MIIEGKNTVDPQREEKKKQLTGTFSTKGETISESSLCALSSAEVAGPQCRQ